MPVQSLDDEFETVQPEVVCSAIYAVPKRVSLFVFEPRQTGGLTWLVVCRLTAS